MGKKWPNASTVVLNDELMMMEQSNHNQKINNQMQIEYRSNATISSNFIRWIMINQWREGRETDRARDNGGRKKECDSKIVLLACRSRCRSTEVMRCISGSAFFARRNFLFLFHLSIQFFPRRLIFLPGINEKRKAGALVSRPPITTWEDVFRSARLLHLSSLVVF